MKGVVIQGKELVGFTFFLSLHDALRLVNRQLEVIVLKPILIRKFFAG